MYDYGSVAMAGDKIITKRHSISAADEIYTLTPADGQEVAPTLTRRMIHIFKQLNLGKVEGKMDQNYHDGEANAFMGDLSQR